MRYIGNKTDMLPHIADFINKNIPQDNSKKLKFLAFPLVNLLCFQVFNFSFRIFNLFRVVSRFARKDAFLAVVPLVIIK